jgi:hypothetical protein
VTTQASIQPRPRDIRVQELTNDSQKIIERDLQCHAQRNRNGLLGRFQRCLQPMRRVALILDAVALAPLVDGLWCYPITGRKNCPCILANFIRRADLRGRRRLLVQDGSAWSHLVPNVPQNRSCHEQGRAPRGNVIIRDGTHKPRSPTQEDGPRRLEVTHKLRLEAIHGPHVGLTHKNLA